MTGDWTIKFIYVNLCREKTMGERYKTVPVLKTFDTSRNTEFLIQCFPEKLTLGLSLLPFACHFISVYFYNVVRKSVRLHRGVVMTFKSWS